MTQARPPQLNALDHLVLTVADIPRAVQFYQDVLSMTVEVFQPTDGTTRTALKFGNQKINLHQAGAEFPPKAKHPRPGSADLCFLTQRPLSDWMHHLASHKIAVLEGPVQRTGASSKLMSIYIRDPDENLIEISRPLP